MTDKEIIIDGVNVAGCEHLKYDKIGCDIDECYCLGSDCYYKQLQRKEQECKLLKSALKNKNFVAVVEENEKLKQECEGQEKIIKNQRKEIDRHRCKQKELKDRLQTLDGNTPTVKITETEFAEYQHLKKQYNELLEINNKRKEEIKNLNYVLYEERELSLDLGKANLKIAKLERDISTHKNRFKSEIDKLRKELSSLLAEKNALEIGRDEYKQECEKLKAYIKSKEGLGDDCDFCKYNKKSECYAKANIAFIKESARYKQALEKVSSILIALDNILPHEYLKKQGNASEKAIQDALNIINEVKEC